MNSFAAHFAQHFGKKPSAQQCRTIMSFEILSTVNPAGLMETWGEWSCTICMKYGIKIIDGSRSRYSRLIDACSEVYGAPRQVPRFHMFTRH